MRVRRMGAADRAPMLELWERSVRATHHFLAPADIEELRPHVRGALSGDAVQWWVLETAAGEPMGFLGFVAPAAIEALFVDPAHFRSGAGTALVEHAQSLASSPLTLDVNEQNPGAVHFYAALGFEVVGRSPTDSAGRPFPLLHMRRSATGSEY